MSFNNRFAPSAKFADGRLILSLPDAETPALWMLDMNDAQTSVLRLESDAKGFYVIKKHGGKGAAETVAVYRDRNRAVHAMTCAAKALEKARGAKTAAGAPYTDGPSRFGRWFIYFVMFWFLLYMLNLDKIILRVVLMPFMNLPVAAGPAETPVAQQPQAAPEGFGGQSQEAPAGVPLSAEEYLKNQPTNLMPN